MKFKITICLFLLLGCGGNSESISFSILNQKGEITEISKSTNKEELNSYKKLIENSNFRKLSLTQSNKDNLIVEQKDDEGYLILVKIRYEQFVIETPLKTLDEVVSIMGQYIEEKDGIMKKTKFY
jgi:hypothetical protein